jgi:hypothetical protein
VLLDALLGWGILWIFQIINFEFDLAVVNAKNGFNYLSAFFNRAPASS